MIGLGAVTETYTVLLHRGPPFCPEGTTKRLGYPARWVVRNKGEIHFAVAESAQCFGEFDLGTSTLAFTVTGGTGIYAGASGAGTVLQVASPSSDGKFRGVREWNGTLTVPGFDFDLTAFMNEYLGVTSVTDDNGNYTAINGGGPFSDLAGVALNYAGSGVSDFSDTVVADGDAVVAFEGTNGNDAAVYKDAGTYQTFFLLFPWEAIGSPTTPSE